MNLPVATDCEPEVLAACFVYEGWRSEALAALSVEDFHDLRHQAIFQAIIDTTTRGEIANAETVLATLGADGLQKAGGLDYFDWVDRQTPTSASAYISVVSSGAEKRRVMRALEVADTDLRVAGADVNEITSSLTRELETVQHVEWEELGSVAALLEESETYDWLIPGLLERGDRVVWTAGEGAGKSTLQMQIAVTASVGLHPFTRVPGRRLSVLYVDLENSRRQIRRGFQLVARGLSGVDMGYTPPRPAGIDIRTSRDFAWLDRYCAKAKPDLIVIGPLYKCFRPHGRESKADETAAEECAFALDRLRERYGCALSIEAHSPHGSNGDREGLRPYGASLWLRWPEFGFGMKKVSGENAVELVPWRGMRDATRAWPKTLYRGARWPWEAA
jgi:replicative DNA helicase